MPNDALPPQIVESIAIVNAKCIGEQPAIYSNLSLANNVFNTNLAQQMTMSLSQALSQITMAVAARSISLVTGGGSGSVTEAQTITESLKQLLVAIKSQNGKAPNNPPEPSNGGGSNPTPPKKENP